MMIDFFFPLRLVIAITAARPWMMLPPQTRRRASAPAGPMFDYRLADTESCVSGLLSCGPAAIWWLFFFGIVKQQVYRTSGRAEYRQFRIGCLGEVGSQCTPL